MNGQLMSIGTVAAANIAHALELPEKHVPVIEQAIKDEVTAMGSHFTLVFADIQTQYEAEVARLKSEWTYVEANKLKVAAVLVGLLLLGVLIGRFA